ncbi:hypothetical protein IDJ75_11445 [Mucilaginibacter rigui]|uniref:Uncharacterized protein n=1 Tax=Mucilaginibacter rigui TaxID=534635 RepID=A0ABR7X5P2_9SPHI|nr:hypothetical protein [Mucilaginibacter rigui]MBD1385896.1 hypothetical protein [Mucilaginibacter rigui]
MPEKILSTLAFCGSSLARDFFHWFGDRLHELANVPFHHTILVLFSTVLAGFISITVPVALRIVSRHTDEYKDKEISDSFLNEPSYAFQVYAVTILVVFALLVFGLKVDNGWLVYLILLFYPVVCRFCGFSTCFRQICDQH